MEPDEKPMWLRVHNVLFPIACWLAVFALLFRFLYLTIQQPLAEGAIFDDIQEIRP